MSDQCRRFDERLAALLADDDQELRRHLEACAACRAEAERHRELFARLRSDEVAAAAPDGLHAGILRALDAPAPRPARRPWRTFAIAGGLSAALALGAVIFFKRPHPRHLSNPMPGAVEALGLEDEDPCQLIGEIDDDELARVTAYFKPGA